MMKHKIVILANSLFYAASLLMLTACSEEILMQSRTPILLEASNIPAQTRADSYLQNDAFKEGQKISAYITSKNNSGEVTTIGNPTTYTTSAPSDGKNTLTPDVMPYYPNEDVTIDIHALYPQDVKTTLVENDGKFSVSDDQTGDDTYMACDLMYASVSNHPRSDQAIALQFHHKMAKVTVNATLEEPLTINSVKLNGVKLTAPFNAETGVISDAVGDVQTILLASTTGNSLRNLSGSVLFPPQTVTNANFIQVETNLGAAKFAITSKQFEEGKEYIVELNINLENLTTTAAITNWDAASGVYTVTKVNKTGLQLMPITETFTYNGSAQTPSSVTVIDAETIDNDTPTVLTSDTHYTMQYFSNTNAGAALAVAVGVTGSSYESSSSVQTFVIRQAEATNMAFGSTTVSEEYQIGKTLINPLTTTGVTAESTIDGNITYTSSNTDVAEMVDNVGNVRINKDGTTVIKASLDGNGNYKAKEVEYTLNVSKRKIAEDDGSARADGKLTIELGTLENNVYDGTAKKRPVVVYDYQANGTAQRLWENDATPAYTLSYSNNVNAGTATVVVTGINKYQGTRTLTYDISKAQAVITMNTAAKTLGIGETYDLEASSTFGTIEYSINVTSGSNPIEVSSTGVVTAKSAGQATITASVPEGENYLAAESRSIIIKVVAVETRYPEGASSYGSYTYTCPEDAVYTFELVGAAGANGNDGKGGKGGIVKASKQLSKGTVVYVYVGGMGNNANTGITTGGYNGGGACGSTGGGSGGGETDIRIGGTGIDARVLVAGGGGGATSRYAGGKNGGASNAGGSGVAFQGDNYISSPGGGGGGGYRGGRGGFSWGNNRGTGGYGGTNYIGSGWTKITNGVSANGPSSASDTGAYNGYVIITYQFN